MSVCAKTTVTNAAGGVALFAHPASNSAVPSAGGQNILSLHLYNEGAVDVHVGFDADLTTSAKSMLLKANTQLDVLVEPGDTLRGISTGADSVVSLARRGR